MMIGGESRKKKQKPHTNCSVGLNGATLLIFPIFVFFLSNNINVFRRVVVGLREWYLYIYLWSGCCCYCSLGVASGWLLRDQARECIDGW